MLLQGFDVARQILEHRLDEADYLVQHGAALANGSLSWQDAKDALVRLAAKGLATDQEKSAFAFYLAKSAS